MNIFLEYPESPDHDALAALVNRAEPLRVKDGAAERETDKRRIAAGCASRWVVARGADGQLVGAAWVGHEVFSFQPEHPRFWIAVEPSTRGCGVGSALWQTIRHLGRALGAQTFKTSTTVPDAENSGFAHRHGFTRLPGFVGFQRALGAVDLAGLDRELAVVESNLVRRGLVIRTMGSESVEPDFWQRYADFNGLVAPDLPGPVPCTVPSPAALRAEIMDNPRAMMDRSFVAVAAASGQIVGVSSLMAGSHPGEVFVGLTAVDAAWRRLGMARYLKNRAMLEARRGGAEILTTMCFEGNARMLKLNADLGFSHAYDQSIWCHTPVVPPSE